MASITNDHELSNSKQCKFILLNPGGQENEIKGLLKT